MEKLKPCPFRGCKVSVEIERPGWPHPDVNLYVIQDRLCGIRMANEDRGKLEETWNARSSPELDYLRARNAAANEVIANTANWMLDERVVLSKVQEMLCGADAVMARKGQAPSKFSKILGAAVQRQIQSADVFLETLREEVEKAEDPK